MEDNASALHESVAELARAVDRLERRLAALEARAGIVSEAPAPPPVPSSTAGVVAREPAAGEAEGSGLLPLIGRTCLVLGGAYLLRWLTGAGTFPRALGTAVGLAYALVWLVLAWRESGSATPSTARAGDTAESRGGRSLRASAAFHAGATALIAFPLLWEAADRVAAMALVTAAGIAVAWHGRIQPIAWVTTLAGLLASLAFMAAGAVPPAIGLYLAFLGVVTLWCGYSLDWVWLRWPVAAAADLTVLAMVTTASQVWHRDEAGGVLLVQMALFGGYLVSFAARTLWRSRDVILFEVFQTIALLAVGFGGAVYLIVTTGSSAAPLGLASLVFGAGSYAVAFAFVDWRRGHWKNFVFYASLAATFVLAGTALSVGPVAQSLIWSGLGAVSALAGRRQGSITLSSHAALYTVAAAIQSGLLACATSGLLAPAASPWPSCAAAALVVLSAAGFGCATPLSGANESWGPWSRAPKLALAVVLVWSAGGTLAAFLVPVVAGTPGSGADPAVVAAVRTVIVAGAALALGWSSRRSFPEGRWLMYLLLVAGGLKLAAEDFPQGRPATLTLAFAAYGAALIFGPRLAGRPERRPAASPPTATP
jgi:hypothetical protein